MHTEKRRQPFANPVMLTSHGGKLDFHIHHTGFLVAEVNGAPTDLDGLRDTFSVPPEQNGKPGEAKFTMPFTNPEIVGRSYFTTTS
jgi:hypothetical protein